MAADNINLDEYTANDNVVQIHEDDGETYGEAAEDLN